MSIIALLCILAAILLLIVLSAIDLKHWILPDELNLALGVAGIVFHLVTAYRFLDWTGMAMGAAIGAGFLYIIRFFSNRHYGRDTLGLGDVKLLAAAGLWLGLEGTLEAITIGAAAGLVHGLLYAAYISRRDKTPYSVRQLSIPAGPGFAVGIAVSGWFMYHSYVAEIINDLTA
jgi:prepilin signal peptidase PulO-like enzyme (type II secretory pathway)